MDSGFARVGSASSRRHSTCLSEESESPRLDRKRGPGEFSELVLGILPRPGIKYYTLQAYYRIAAKRHDASNPGPSGATNADG